MRLYDTNGNKINKGYLFATTDSSLVLYKGDAKVELPASQLGYIKPKHSVGHRIGRAAVVTAAVITVIPAVVILLHLTRAGNKGYIRYPENKNVNPDLTPSARKLKRKYIVGGSLENWKQQRIQLQPFL